MAESITDRLRPVPTYKQTPPWTIDAARAFDASHAWTSRALVIPSRTTDMDMVAPSVTGLLQAGYCSSPKRWKPTSG